MSLINRLTLLASFGFISIGAAACSSNASTATSSSPTTDAGGATNDASESAAAPCVDVEVTARRSKVSISPARDHHVTLIHEVGGVPYLYVVGGAANEFASFFDDVQRARIRDDGELEAFEPAGKLASALGGMGLAVVGDDVVLSGGTQEKRPYMVSSTQVGHFAADGTLGSWKAGPDLPDAVMHAASVAVGREIYVFGGTLGAGPSNQAVHIRLETDGTLGALLNVSPLVPARSHQAAFVANGRVYMSGGLDKDPNGNPPSRDDVQSATLREDGSLGGWEAAGKLPSRLSVHPAQVVGCSMITAGGLDDISPSAPFTAAIRSVRLEPDGTVSNGKTHSAKLSLARGHIHQLPRHGKFMYAVGGRVADQTSTGVIDILTLADAP